MIGFAILVNELGVIPALIQAEDIDDTIIRQVYGFVLAFNAILFAIVFISAPYFAAFFNDERLIDIVRVLGSILLITALGAVPTALLQRDIRFKGISIVEFASMIAGSATTLVLAVSGHGVWSLILGNIAQVSHENGRHPDRRPNDDHGRRSGSRGLGRYFSFGAKVTGQKILWYANSQIDIILIGKLLGNQALGLYSVSYHLATMPMSKFLMIVNQVAFPAYSRLQSDVPLARDYFFKSVRLTALMFFPLLWGLSSVSAEFVETFLGDKWIDGWICLAIVTLAVPFRVMSMLLSPVVDGLGHPGVGLRNLITFSALLPAAMAVGTNWGIIGVSCGLVGASAVALVINFHRSLPLLGSSSERNVPSPRPEHVFGGWSCTSRS